MAITLADIDRWDPGGIRDVATALGKRGASAEEVKAGLTKLPLIASWQGSGGDGARAALDMLSKHLAAHAEEMAAVSTATGKAAEEVEEVKRAQQRILDDANREGFAVDRATGTVTPRYPDRANDPRYVMEQHDLERRITEVLAKANSADADLARAITSGAGTEAGRPIEDRPEVRDALNKPLPEDPKQFHDLWDKLTPQEKDWLYAQDHSIGNHPGMPWAPGDGLGRDHYNRLHLPELEQEQQATVDRLQHQADALASEAYMGDHDAASALSRLAPQLQAARRELDGFKAVDQALGRKDGVPRLLGLLDDQGHAAVSIQNPDTASRNAVFVPGTGQDMAALQGSDLKSLSMYQAALAADRHLNPGDVAVTTWMGYDRPMDLWQAASPGRAEAGGVTLDQFVDGMHASHVGGPSIDTVIGHSYGSTVVGAAGAGGNHLSADNVIGVGSPGMIVAHADGLSLDQGTKVYTMTAPNDIIQMVPGKQLGLGWDPDSTDFGATRLEADPGPRTWGLFPSVPAHSSYWDPGSTGLRNLGAIIAGQPPAQLVPPGR